MVGEITERIAVAKVQAAGEELRARTVSGLVLAAVALMANWGGSIWLAVLVTAIAVVMTWEWSHVVRSTGMDVGATIQAVVVTVGAGLAWLGMTELGALVIAAGAAAVAFTCIGRHPAISGLGALFIGLPTIVLIWLRNDAEYGALAVLFVFIVVWTTDTFAFACGKLIGGPKLWPRLSPMKTWAGTLGGLVFAGLAGVVFAWGIDHSHPNVIAATSTLLSAAAQVGDLAESALKRTFSVKHASHLIPGHGGFMDRMDGIVGAALLAGALAALIDAHAPARALLFGS